MRWRASFLAAALAAACLAADPAAAAFDKGGLIGASPRSAALAGSDFAAGGGLVSECAADLAGMGGPDSFGSVGVATRAGLTATRLRAGTGIDGMGIAASYRALASQGSVERAWEAALGLPVEEVPGLSFGAALKGMGADLAGAKASGMGFDISVRGRVPVPSDWFALDAAAGVDDVFGSIEWADGLREELSRQVRVALAARLEGSLAAMAEGRLVRGEGPREGLAAFGVEHAFAVRGVAAAIRIGWRDGTHRAGTLSAGLGASWGPGRIDYAIVGATRSQGYLHAVSARWSFGAGKGPLSGGAAMAGSAGAEGESLSSRRRATDAEVLPEEETLVASSPWRAFAFAVRAPRAGRIEGWSVLVIDGSGAVVWSAEGSGSPPATVAWNGSTQRGDLAPAGRYTARLVIRGTGAVRNISPGVSFRLVRPPEPRRGPEPPAEGGF